MRRWMVISLLLSTMAAAGCATETHVVRGSTLTQKFAALGKNGWTVSGEGVDGTRQAGHQPNDLHYTGNGTSFFGPGGPEWKTNFKTDDPTPATPAQRPVADTQPAALDPFTGLPIPR